ncbi:sulfite exporter TauE/SafE family protein [Hydrogenophaga sp. OTU3427]|uniref:sulfite exporter TauE/SafE family protein n=1 Tax=Hydrogenophaga sp. OTU3427 TaxID=3043856 RepID=UPI00313E1C11
MPALDAASLSLLTLCALAFVLGGVVKGALGVGLPLVAVPLLSLWLPSPQAIALLVAPVLLSNLWQAVEGGRLRGSLRRFGGLIAAQCLATVLTVRLTLSLSVQQLNVMLALAVLLAVALMAWQPSLRISPERERVVGVGVGLLSGLLGGVSSLTGPVIITYLMALKLPREDFIGSISIIYLSAAVPLYGAMLLFGRIGASELALSVLALLPMGLGLLAGKAVRRRLDEILFRRVLLAFLCVLAALLLFK